MRYLIAAFILLFVTGHSSGQSSNCQSERYQERIFTNTIQHQNVKYGEAMNYLDQMEDLRMHVFEPAGDTLAERPLIIFAHSGGFQAGSKNADDMMAMCDTFARKGYVTATIGYRKGFVSTNAGVKRAVYRGVQDGKAAVRYFRHYADSFGIDTSHIFMTGSSAGAFIALHCAYADKPSERPQATYGTPIGPDLGCMDCAGNNFSNSSNVQAITSLWGAMPDTTMIEDSTDQPALLIHGANDVIVPMRTGNPFSVPLFPQTEGSAPISQRMQHVGVSHEFYPYQNKGHEVYGATNGSFVVGGPNALWDTVLNHMTDFFYRQLIPPTPPLTGDTSICQGDTGLYLVDAPSSMRHCWQVDNGTMTSRTDTSIRVEWAETAAQGSLLLRSQSRIGVHTSIQTKSVQLKPLPTITTITDTAICPGDSITLQASGANTYQWAPEDHLQDASSATPTAYPRQQTTFTATGYGGNGCRARSEVNVSVHPSPGTDFDFGGNPPTISFTDQSNQATTWFWHFGDGATSTQANPTHTYQDEDFYDVTLISKNDYGCRDTSEQRIAVFYATSIDNNNPSAKQLAIQRVGQRRVEISLGEDRTRPIQIRAYTLLGEEIISRSFGSTKSIILDLTHTKSNIVILQFIWEDQTFSKKIRTGMRSIE